MTATSPTPPKLLRFGGLVLLFMTIFTLVACQGKRHKPIKITLLKAEGGVSLHTRQNPEGKPLNIPRRLPQRATLQSQQLAQALIQFNEFLLIELEGNSRLRYEITPLHLNPKHLYRLDITLEQGGAFIKRRYRGIGDSINLQINQYFLAREKVACHLSHIREHHPPQKARNYFTATVIQGGLYFISPVTGEVDIFIKNDKKFILENNIDHYIQSLNSEEIAYWQKKQKLPFRSPQKIKSLLSWQRPKLLNRAWAPWALAGLALAAAIGLAFWGYFSKYNKQKRYAFDGQLVFWDFNDPLQEEQSVQLHKKKGKQKIYLGNKGYCHVKIPDWEGSRAYIKGELESGQEKYTIHNSQNQIAFLRRQNPDTLTHGDEFVIHNIQFRFELVLQGEEPYYYPHT